MLATRSAALEGCRFCFTTNDVVLCRAVIQVQAAAIAPITDSIDTQTRAADGVVRCGAHWVAAALAEEPARGCRSSIVKTNSRLLPGPRATRLEASPASEATVTR